MHKTRGLSDNLSQMRQERDDIVFRLALNGVDAGHIKDGGTTLFPDRCCSFFGDHPKIGKRIADMGFDLEQDEEFRFGRPNGHHFGAGITWDHERRLTEGAGRLNGYQRRLGFIRN